MVISFSHQSVFDRLEEQGVVVTFRQPRRKRPNCQTWCNRGRGEAKSFNVGVSEIGCRPPTKDALGGLAPLSSFESVEAWQEAIHEYNDNPSEGWLYLVTRIDQPQTN